MLRLAPAAPVGRALDLRSGGCRRVDVLDELDLGPLEEAVKLLDVGFVHVELGDRALNLGVAEHADLLALGEQSLDLFELLKFCY